MAAHPDALQQHWVHSHEEDTDTEMVFRPASFAFPPSRGRRGFELKPGGVLVEVGPSPADRKQRSEGAWRLEDGNCLAFCDRPGAPPRRVLHIASLAPDRLVVKK